jgi:hypothetical protein
MHSDDQQQHRLAAVPADAAYLGAPVQQQAHAAGVGVLHCSGVISSLVGACQVDSLRSQLLVPLCSQETALAQARIGGASRSGG